MTEKTPASQVRCGNCGAVGQWKATSVTRLHARGRGKYQTAPYDEESYLELECVACGVITTANPARVSRP